MNAWIFVAGWIACGIAAAGIFVAYFQGRWPALAEEQYRTDLGMGLFLGLGFGPIALAVAFFFSGFCEHGWRLTRRK